MTTGISVATAQDCVIVRPEIVVHLQEIVLKVVQMDGVAKHAIKVRKFKIVNPLIICVVTPITSALFTLCTQAVDSLSCNCLHNTSVNLCTTLIFKILKVSVSESGRKFPQCE